MNRLFLVTALIAAAPAAAADAGARSGEAVYRFYCYQCHGYAGDAKTLASTYLDPRPRDFTATEPGDLGREAMVEAVTSGRAGTAMTSFESVLSAAEIGAVVDYVRASFMTAEPRQSRYHSPANGWRDHQRYQAAFPFVNGELRLDTPGEQLTDEQRLGKRLYLEACVSCHDHGGGAADGPLWQSQAVSYPRRHYSHISGAAVDGVSSATPFARHDIRPQIADLQPGELRGRGLFEDNCAFCHAANGSGQNWIGSFLQPKPRNLTGTRVASMADATLHRTIARGLPGTSMPSWRGLLDDGQIDDIIGYIRRLPKVADDDTGPSATAPRPRPVWQRQPPAADRGAPQPR